MQTVKVEITMVSCDRCGNTWQKRVEAPVKCPKCGHRFDSPRIYNTKKPKASAPSLDSKDTLAATAGAVTTND